MVEKFKHRFYIKKLFIWICKANYKILSQTNPNIAATASDLILVQNFYLQMEAWEKISLFLELK